jgi:hypothetical protein
MLPLDNLERIGKKMMAAMFERPLFSLEFTEALIQQSLIALANDGRFKVNEEEHAALNQMLAARALPRMSFLQAATRNS